GVIWATQFVDSRLMKGPRVSWLKNITQISLLLNHSSAITTEFFFSSRSPRAGASGYWMKTSTREELIRALDTILAGELYVSPRIASRVVHEVVNGPATHPKVPNLTDRELHVFTLKGAGLGTSRIAQELGISPKTVET